MERTTLEYGKIVWGSREVTVLPGEVRIYARKSLASESAENSIAEQVENARRQCERMGLPVSDEDILEEKPGRGGDEFWEGGGSTTRELDGRRKRYRPELTRLVQDIKSGMVKALFVWDQTRLWRSVKLCGALLDVLAQNHVLLYDRNGVVDIYSPEGRQMVHFLAAVAQHHREISRENSMRGTQGNRERGEAAYGGRALGYRSVSGVGIVPVLEELTLVRRIFEMYVHGLVDDAGERRRGSMCFNEITDQLTSEGCEAFANLYPKRRRHSGKVYVYHESISRVIDNPRYIGKQRHGKNPRLYDAKEFLVNGETAIPLPLWTQAQNKRERNRRLANRAVGSHALSGWLRCGVCARKYGRNPQMWEKGGEEQRTEVWRIRSGTSYHECQDGPRPFLAEDLDAYVHVYLAPLLLAEMREQKRIATGSTIENKIAELRIRKSEVDAKKRNDLPKLLREHWQKNPALAAQVSQMLEDELCQLDNEILRLQLRSRYLDEEIAGLQNIRGMDVHQYRDLLRAVILWVAVVPGEEDEADRLLFLTTWGTYHTAVVEPSQNRSNALSCSLRPASAGEALGSVKDLPDPKRFFGNLERERVHAAHGVFNPEEWAPGYASSSEAEIIEIPFEWLAGKEAA